MRFFDLPVEMNVGGAHLTPVNGYETLKEYTCFCCDRMSLAVFVCCNQHVLCRLCYVSDLWPSKLVWCPVCKQTVTASEARLSTKTLDELQFRCACGLMGSLVDMKTHLLQEPIPGEGQKLCGSEIDRTGLLETAIEMRDEEDRMRNIALEEIGRMKQTMLNELIQKLNNKHISELTVGHHSDKVNRIVEQKMEQLKGELAKKIETQKTEFVLIFQKKIESALENIKHLEQTVSSEKELIIECKNTLANKTLISASTSTSYLWFNFEALFRRFKTAGTTIRSRFQSTVVAGVNLSVFLRLEKEANKDYLGVFATLIKGSANDTPVPLHRKLILKIHDINGMDAATLTANTLLNGEYYFSSGPSSRKDRVASGSLRMISVNSLREKNCLVGKMICVSIGVSPMK